MGIKCARKEDEGKRGEKGAREREREGSERRKEIERENKRRIAPVRCLFERRTLNTWSRCTHGSYGSRLKKIKKTAYWRDGENAGDRTGEAAAGKE